MWFEELCGFSEDGTDVRSQITVDGEYLVSAPNGRRMRWGRFEMASLAALRERSIAIGPATAVREVTSSIGRLHTGRSGAGATFQVASQFNMLEMVGPGVTPEDGIDGYEHDPTQGPACAIACGAGTIYRNYFVPIGDQLGQTADRQLNGLADVADLLGVEIPMRNGYAEPSSEQLAIIAGQLRRLDDPGIDRIRGALRVGVQWDTEVTQRNAGHTVTQVFCSALPVSYFSPSPAEWEPFARLVLEAAYEATLLVAAENAAHTGNHTVYMTMLGGGAFGNDKAWIVAAIERAIKVAGSGLDIAIVSYRRSEPAIAHLLTG